MTQEIDFIFDFGSPNAYFAHKVLPEIEGRTGARFRYIPCLLGGIFKATNNQAPMMAFGNVKGKMEYERLEIRRFIIKHKLSDFVFNKHFPVNSLLMMRAAVAAERDDALMPYVQAGMAAMWEDNLNMSEPDVFVAAMEAHGLDGPALLAATQDAEVKAQLASNTEAAVKRGAFGSPTFYVGDEMFFGKERLGQLEDEILKQA